ncbi:MAG: two-component regulator propeller domain-containing protein [Caldimonas sp.]
MADKPGLVTKTRRSLGCVPWCVLLVLFCCADASALSKDGAIRDLRYTAWGPKEGSPSAIQSIAQTNDGYLWLANGAGLYRFDGLHFEHVELPHSDRVFSPNIYVLFTPSYGGLWIGFTYGGAGYLKDGHLTVYTESDGLPKGTVFTFAEDADGVVWAGTNTGVARLEDSHWRAMGSTDGYSDIRTYQLMVDSEGTLWAASRSKVLFLRRGARTFQESTVQPAADALTAQFTPLGIAETLDGSIWYLYNDRLLLLHKTKPGGRGRSSGFGARGDRDGNLWFFRHAKLQRLPRPGELAGPSWDPAEDLADSFSEKDGVISGLGYPPMLEDREGNLWFASFAGLCRLSESTVKRMRTTPDSQGLKIPNMPALAAAEQGDLWIGSLQSPLLHLQAGKLERVDDVGFVTAATRTNDGTVWLGSSAGLWRQASGQFVRVPAPENKDAQHIAGIAQDGIGALWISIQRLGVYRLKDGVWTRRGGIASMPPDGALTLATDSKQRVWFGYMKGEVAVLDGDSVRTFSGPSRLSVGHVTAIYGKRGSVWVGGELGLAVFDGSGFRDVKPQDGPAFTNVTGVVETADGDVWLNTSAGIVRIAAAETLRAMRDPLYRVRAQVFDVLDGVEGGSARTLPVPSVVEGTDGRLWFSTSIGLYWIDPKALRRNTTPPPVLIESVSVGDTAYAPQAELRLPHGTTSVRIDYIGLSLTMAEKVRYRYELDGVDGGWQNAQGRRQAFYTNLVPGPHRFQVIASNNDGVWNEAGATLVFDIPPSFVQTRWFIVLCVSGAGLVAWMLVRLRFRQLSARLRERLEARHGERERIARELHDTLLQSTQGLVLHFQAFANGIASDDPSRHTLEKALARADRVLEEGRDRVLDLRVASGSTPDLEQALAAAGQELSHGRTTAFRVFVEGAPREIERSVSEEAYRIGREALLNAFQHANARSIEVQVIFGQDTLRVRVMDDGVGIDTNAVGAGSPPGHWGLKGMQERAKEVGATVDVWSRPGAGTEVELQIPAALAYVAVQARPRWWRIPFLEGSRRLSS